MHQSESESPHLHIPQYREQDKAPTGAGWKRPLKGIVALSLVLLAATWTIVWQRLDAEREMVSHNSRMQQQSLALIVSENLAQILDRGRLLALTSVEAFSGSRKDAGERLSAIVATDRAFLRIALYDTSLQRIYTSSPTDDSNALIDAVSATLEEALGDEPAVLKLAPLPSSHEEAWQLPLLFPVIGGDRKMQGILLATLDLGYLLGLYREIDIGGSGVIQILQTTGEEVARARQGGLEYPSEAWRTTHAPSPETRRSSLVTELFGDGLAYQASFEHLVRYPFVVVISRGVDELQTEYKAKRARFLLVLWLLTAAVLGATLLIVRTMLRQEQLFSALEVADLDKRKLIMQLEDEKRRAFELASHDHLTGLANRRMFLELSASHLSRAKRSRRLYGLLYVDLDRFKNVNDSLGHHVGDLLLQTVAARLRSALRESDVIARLGGDEFAVLLTGLDTVGDMAVIAAKIVDLIGRPCANLDGHDLQISPSIGIAVFPRDGHNIETLSRHADAAMYQSKRSGRGKYTFYDPALNPVCDRQFELEQSLPRAIAEDELILHFQPKIRLSDYRIVGFEALVRWQHPDHGLIHPGEFIPMAESTGLIIDLGDWVTQACCRQLASWRAEGLQPVPVAINVSARQLRDEQLPERIATYLDAYGVNAANLEIEITESSLVESIEIASKVLTALQRIGVGIALDDFGNGYSSLAYIRTLPIHAIKIDRSFINDLRNGPNDAVIVDSIVTLAHNLNMRVIAEGVELVDQLIHLKTIGCDEVQGYYLSRPVAADAARQLIIQATLRPQ
jgi:diguanylate cyclase (GGDEF)-like protein